MRRVGIGLAAIAAVFMLVAGGLWLLLASGPISLDIATPWLAAAVAENFGNQFRIDIGIDFISDRPALNRLLKQRWIAANWEQMPDKNRQARYYRLTSAGRKQLTAEESKWERLAQAIAKVMKRRPEEV